MTCDRWNEAMVTHLYGELPDEDEDALTRHVASCARCRSAWEELSEARVHLRDGAPDVPATPPIVVLADRDRRSALGRSLPALAACAAVLLAGAALTVSLARVGERSEMPQADAVRAALAEERREFDRAIETATRDLVTRDEVDGAIRGATADLVTRDEIDGRIDALRAALSEQRREDVDLLLAEIAASELRSGAALDATRQTLAYYALARNPGVSEW